MVRPGSISREGAAFALLLAAAALLWLARDEVRALIVPAPPSAERAAARAAKPVIAVPLRLGADDLAIEAIGTGRALRSITLRAREAGVVAAMSAAAGARAAAGAPLFGFEDRDARLALQLAENRVAEARRQAARAAELNARGVGSTAEAEDSLGRLERAEIERAQAEAALADRTLVAPFAGVLGLPKVEIGDRVDAGAELATLDDRSALWVEFTIPEQAAPRVTPGAAVAARTPGHPDRVFEGAVDQIDSRVDPVTRAVALRARLPNADDALRPGMSFAVELRLAGPDWPLAPAIAVVWRGGESFVWVVEADRAVRRPVRIRRRRGDQVLLEGDLEPGELVIVDGVLGLREGAAVALRGPSAAEGAE